MPNKQNKMLYRELRFDGAVDETSRTAAISFSSEAPVKRFDWFKGSYYDEILAHDKDSVDLTRLQNLGVALFNHDRNVVIGAVLDPKVDDETHRCTAVIRFDTDEFAETIYQKVKSGTLKGVSVGYSIDSIEEVAAGKKSADGRFSGYCKIARRWTPFEVSIVSVPADIDVGVGRDLDIDANELKEFRQYKAAQRQAHEQAAIRQQNELARRKLEIMEMEM